MTKRGALLRGVMLADDIQPKVVSAKSRVHESTLSRFFNGVKDVQEEQFILICLAIGEARAEKRARVRV